MILNVYVLFDSLAEKFGSPFYETNDACAVRSIKKLLDEKEIGDYKLFLCGTFDNSSDVPLKINNTLQEVEL